MNNIIDEETKQLAEIYNTGYLELLRLNAIIFADEIKEKLETGEYDNYVLNEDFLDNLTILIEVNETEKFLDSNAKSNVLDILSYMQDNMECKKEISKLIARLFSTKCDNCFIFYRNQYLTRNGMLYEKTKNEYDTSIFKEKHLIKNLRYSLSVDYTVVMVLIDGLDKDLDEMMQLIPPQHFINTINVLMYECPKLLIINSFTERVKNILDKISKNELPNIEQTGIYRAKLLLKKLEKKLA